VLQCVALCCFVLQCVAVTMYSDCRSVLKVRAIVSVMQCVGVCCKCVAVTVYSDCRSALKVRAIVSDDRFGAQAPIHQSLKQLPVTYGAATISRLLKIIGLFFQNIVFFIGLFCKRDLYF